MYEHSRAVFLEAAGHVSNVTLVCEDGQQRSSHALLLASSSPLMRQVLLEVVATSCHPLVILLPDFTAMEVEECLGGVAMGRAVGDLAEILDIERDWKASPDFKKNNKKLDGVTRNSKEENMTEEQTKKVNPTEELSCPYCLELFSTSRRMKCHISLEHEQKHEYLNFVDERENKQSICKLCFKAFPRIDGCIQHVKNVHQLGTSLKCHMCDICVYTIEKLKQHISQVHDKSMFICEICEKTFPNYHRRREHMVKVHAIGKKFVCDMCGKYFLNPALLKLHFVRLHGSLEEKMAARKYKCLKCGKGFYKPDRLSEHLITHSEVKPFSCDKCDGTYISNHSLRTHIKQVHFGLMRPTKEQKEKRNAKKRKEMAEKKAQNGGEYRTAEERVVYNEYMRNRARKVRDIQKRAVANTEDL